MKGTNALTCMLASGAVIKYGSNESSKSLDDFNVLGFANSFGETTTEIPEIETKYTPTEVSYTV